MTTIEVKHPLPDKEIEIPASAESGPGSPAHTAVNVQGTPDGIPVAVDVEDLDTLATESTLLGVKTAIENIVVTATVDSAGLATSAKQDLQQSALDAIKTELQTGTLDVHLTDASVAITAASLPLPTGASTEATASAIKNAVEGTLDVNIVSGAAPGTEYDDGETIAMPTGTVVLGHDGSNVQALSTNPAGELKIQIQNFPITQPVSAVSLPLPLGAATETTLFTRASETTAAGTKTAVESIDTKLDGPLNTRVLASGTDSVTTVPSGTQAVGSTQLPATLDAGNLRVAVEASVLPTGAATETTLNAIKTELQTGTLDVNIVSGGASAGTEYADGAAAATPTGTVALGHDGTNVQALSTNGSGELKVQIQNLPATQNVADGGASLTVDSTQLPAALVGGRLSVDGSGVTQPVSAASLPLPAGAATETTLSAINTKAPVLGQTTKSGSVPVTLASDQGNVGVTFSNPTSVATAGGTQPTTSTMVGGSDGSNIQHVRVFDADSGVGSQYVLGAVLRKSASGGSVEAGTASDPLRVDPTGTTTQPVSGTVTANIGTSGSLALDATLTGGTQKAVVRGGAKGSTTAADVTSTASGANNQSLDVICRDASGNIAPTGDSVTRAIFVRATDGSNQMPTGDTSARSIVTRLSDGARDVTVKAGSTAAVAADGALVVAISPNNTVAVSASSLPLPSGAAQDSTLTSGGQKAVVRGGAKGSTAAADVTSTAAGPNHQALDVAIVDSSGNQITSFGGGTEYTSGDSTAGSAQGGVAFGVESGNHAYPIAVDTLGRQLVVGSSGGALALDATVTTLTGKLPASLGQTTMASSLAVVIASNQSAVPVSGTVTANQGTAAALSGYWPVRVTDGSATMPTGDIAGRAIYGRVTDGTNQAAVKAASTAPVAADPALVVTLSPNSPSASSDTSGTFSFSALNQTTPITLPAGAAQLRVAITGSSSLSNTLLVESSGDGSTWVTIPWRAEDSGVTPSAYSIADISTALLGTSAMGVVYPVNSQTSIRIRCSAWVSGTISVAWRATTASLTRYVYTRAFLSNGSPAATGSSTSDTFFTKLTDGTSTAAVKAASTAAATTDPAMVVQLSPNSPGNATSTLSNVSASASNVNLLTASSTRKMVVLANDSTSVCYVKLGTTASSTSYTYYMAGSVSGVPSTVEIPYYNGNIDAIWASATGSMRVTSITV